MSDTTQRNTAARSGVGQRTASAKVSDTPKAESDRAVAAGYCRVDEAFPNEFRDGMPVQVTFNGFLTAYADHLGRRKISVSSIAQDGTVVHDEILLPPDALLRYSLLIDP